jgi:glycosyltransferase involved in cell wall biosynthesis
MRIAIVTPRVSGTGGVESVNGYLVRTFREAGHKVNVFGLDSLPDCWVRRRAVSRWGTIKVVGEWFNIVNRLRRYDVVICNGEFARAVRHPRAVNLFHGSYFGYANAVKEYVPSASFDAMMRQAAIQEEGAQDKIVVAVSAFMAEVLKEQGIAADAVIPDCVDTDLFSPDTEVVPTDECLFVGRCDYYGKGFDVLEALADRGIRIRCITDRDPQHSGLLWTPFLGQNHLPSHYRRAACLVLPSRFESVGLVALEAMACGCPVVMSDVGVGRELRQEIPECVVVGEPGCRTNEFCTQIASVIDNRRDLSARARHYVLRGHTYPAFAERWQHLVSHLCE